MSAAQGRMTPRGTEKTCRKCGSSFAVLTRADCPAVYCYHCRPKPPRRGVTLTVRRCAAPGCARRFNPTRDRQQLCPPCREWGPNAA